MKRLDRLIISELVGPWAFGVAIFSALIFASVLLVRVTEWVVRGINPNTVMEVAFLLMPGIVVKTFAMAMLLATLLAFGRLSNDSEVVALKAAGTSLFRIMRPVLAFGLAVAFLSFALNEAIVPGAAARATALTTEIKKQIDKGKGAKPVFYTIQGKNGAVAQLMALDFSLVDQTLRHVTLSTFDSEKRHSTILLADELRYFGPRDWRIIGDARLLKADGKWVLGLKDAWPREVAQPDITPQNLLAGFADDLDVFSIGQMVEQIRKLKSDPNPDNKQIANLQFGLYNKVALPLGVVVFALLGAPLGIRNARAGMAVGFALSVALSFLYLMLANFMAVYAKGGAIPPWLASFLPILIGAAAAGYAIYRKNQ
ncbi:MAG: LptF/LptG family permease [Armatimonadetes bacterium]|nr:LptF/LptG family permease [Armatimonadota bacterium]